MKAVKRLLASALVLLMVGCGKSAESAPPAASTVTEGQEQRMEGLLTAWDGQRYYTKENVICDSADMTARPLKLSGTAQELLEGYPVTDGQFLYYSTASVWEEAQRRGQMWRSNLDGTEAELIWQGEPGTREMPLGASLNGWSDNILRLTVFRQQGAVWFFIGKEGWITSPQVFRCEDGQAAAQPVEYPEPLPVAEFAGEMDGQPVFRSFREESSVYWQLELATGAIRELAVFPGLVKSNLLIRDGMLYLQDTESGELSVVDLASGERRVLWSPEDPEKKLWLQYVWGDHAFLIYDKRPIRCYSLDLNDGSVTEVTLRGSRESDGGEFVVYARAPLGDCYVVVYRRGDRTSLAMNSLGEPMQWQDEPVEYALIEAEDYWNNVPEYRYFTCVDDG